MTNRENNGENLIKLIVDTISQEEGIKVFLKCIKYPEHRRAYLQKRISGLFGEDKPSTNFLVKTLYEVQERTEINLDIVEVDNQLYLRRNIESAVQSCEVI